VNRPGIRRVGPSRRTPTTEERAISETDPPMPPGRRAGALGAWLRLAVGVAVLVVLVVRLGAGPFTDALELTTGWSLLAATAITAVTTACCAWRWRLVSGALGAPLDAGSALGSVSRAQFLNATLPGGVVGDVDRALRHARGSTAAAAGARSVVWERSLGQVVQVALTVGLLLAAPSAVREAGAVAGAVGLVALAAVIVAGRLGRRSRLVRVPTEDLRRILADRRGVPVVLLSAASVAGHLLVFVIAAHVAGVRAPATTLVPIAAVVMLGAAVPANVAGWGPREGVAVWAFGAAGLDAGAGLTTSVVYGVMALVATLPGAVVLLAGRRTGARSVRRQRVTAGRQPVLLGQAAHG
jgi:uncharacterized membrane protein YbhN (UPF0104 family)